MGCRNKKHFPQFASVAAPTAALSLGKPTMRTHDDKRLGTTSLFAALDVATGNGYGQLRRHHRSVEFLEFLKVIDAEVPGEQDID